MTASKEERQPDEMLRTLASSARQNGSQSQKALGVEARRALPCISLFLRPPPPINLVNPLKAFPPTEDHVSGTARELPRPL